MTLEIIAFALGIAVLQWQAGLPSLVSLGIVALAGGALLLVIRGTKLRVGRASSGSSNSASNNTSSSTAGRGLRVVRRACRWLAWGFVGFAWAGLLAQQRLADEWAPEVEGQDVEVVGIVSAMPQRFENGWRFVFQVESSALPVPKQLSLAWYQSRWLEEDGQRLPLADVHAGERWRFTVRLKRPHSNANPHGFDYEAWLLEQGIRATGYVRSRAGFARLDSFVATPGTLVERVRETLRTRFATTLGDRPALGILVALAVGDQRGIPNDQWQVFSRTGLTHLFSVSGLHITMVAGLVYAVVGWAWRRGKRLSLHLPAQQAAALAGMTTALAYCLLAGFAVPAQRTLYMLSVVGLASLLRRSLAVHQILALALGAVLLLDPWAVLAPGFWLSFGAVALLFYIGAGRVGTEAGTGGAIRAWGRAQWAMTVGMVPLLLLLFQQFSLVSPLANGIAIPLVSFVVTPLALLAAVPGLEILLIPAAWFTERLLDGCQWLATSPGAVWQQYAPTPGAVALGLVGTLWLLAPRGFPARWLGAVFFLPLFLMPPPRPLPGEARMTVLDVGQGLSVYLQTANHDLLFDTGPLFSPDANSGNRIIVPYLRAVGVTRLDGLVVSHADKDHSGGAASVLEQVPTGWLLHALPSQHALLLGPERAMPCFDGQQWEWDGVRFSVLHPRYERHADPTPKTNDMSCVLRMDTAHGSALIPSDIEAISEAGLLSRHSSDLAADVLVAPHHGSKTSSTEAFIAAVKPSTVIFPVGYRNRFGHPRRDVVARYESGDRALYRTDQSGALSLDFLAQGMQVREERREHPRYWYQP